MTATVEHLAEEVLRCLSRYPADSPVRLCFDELVRRAQAADEYRDFEESIRVLIGGEA